MISSVYQVAKKDEPKLIDWNHLCDQFSVSPNNAPRFKVQFGESLFKVQQAFYPQARVHRHKEGIFIDRSPLLTREKTDNMIMLPAI